MSNYSITTKRGNEVDLIDFDKNIYDIDDIADTLSKQWRWNGCIDRFYSVAEHCVHVSKNVPDEFALDALMHDASEAYICDLPSPVKALLPEYKRLETSLMQSMANQFGFNFENSHKDPIKAVDLKMLLTEHLQLRKNTNKMYPVLKDTTPYEWVLPCWSTGIARLQFLNRYNYLMEKRKAA